MIDMGNILRIYHSELLVGIILAHPDKGYTCQQHSCGSKKTADETKRVWDMCFLRSPAPKGPQQVSVGSLRSHHGYMLAPLRGGGAPGIDRSLYYRQPIGPKTMPYLGARDVRRNRINPNWGVMV